MKAIVVTTPGRAEVRDVPMPEYQPNEALVKIEACGLCGTTDRHLVEGCQAHHPADWYPAILGHESVGIVVEVGAEVRKFRVGDRVTRPVALWPGTQRNGLYSAWGGFAEYGIVRELPAPGDYTADRQHVVPPSLSLDQAVLALSISEVASWMAKVGDLRGRTAVIGGTGFAAAVMCQVARADEAQAVIAVGRSERKLTWARHNGATHALQLNEATRDAIRQLCDGAGADWFLDAAGHQAVFEQGLAYLRPGGQAAIYGAPEGFAYRLPLGAVGGDFTVHYYAPNDDAFFARTCEMIRSGDIRPELIQTHTWRGLEQFPKALAEQAAGEVLKGVLHLAS